MVANLDSQVNPGRAVAANCEELAQRGEWQNGVYLIQPSTEVAPFEVTCDFQDGQTLTVIHHDKPERQMTATPGQTDGCEGNSSNLCS